MWNVEFDKKIFTGGSLEKLKPEIVEYMSRNFDDIEEIREVYFQDDMGNRMNPPGIEARFIDDCTEEALEVIKDAKLEFDDKESLRLWYNETRLT